MDKSKMTEEQRLYFFYGYLYNSAQKLHEEFGTNTIEEYMQILLDGMVKANG